MEKGFMDGEGKSALFNSPIGISLVEFDGSLLVADMFNHRIRRIQQKGTAPNTQFYTYNLPTGRNYVVETVAGCGTKGDMDGELTACKFNEPRGLCIDSITKTCYVADSGNNKLKKFSLLAM